MSKIVSLIGILAMLAMMVMAGCDGDTGGGQTQFPDPAEDYKAEMQKGQSTE
jgi:hypothetical protein